MFRNVMLALLLVAACSNEPSGTTAGKWQVIRRVTLDEGESLHPDDPARPGEANPQALAVVGGKVYVALTNLFLFAPAGPSWLSVHDGQTLARESLIELQTLDAKCTNAGFTRAHEGKLFVTCAGSISQNANEPSEDGFLFELALPAATVTRVAKTGLSPGAILFSGSNIWMADLETPSLLRVDAESGAVVNGLGAESPLPICAQGFASDLALSEGRAFASCFNDDTVQEFDPVSGARVGAPISVGDGPIRLAPIGGRLAVLNSLGGTVTLLTVSGQPSVQSPAIKLGGDQGGNDSEGLAGNESWAAATNAGAGTLVVLDVQNGFQLTDAIDLKASFDAPTNSPHGVEMDGDAFYITIAGWGAPASEIVRIARE